MNYEEEKNKLLSLIVMYEQAGKIHTANYIRTIELPILERQFPKPVKRETFKNNKNENNSKTA